MANEISLKGKEIFCADRIVNEGRATLFEDVERVADAIARKQLTDEVKNEIRRLGVVITGGKLQEIVANRCGKEKLLLVLRKAKGLRCKEEGETREKPKESKINDEEWNKYNESLRKKWVKKFKAKYGTNGGEELSEDVYNAIIKASHDVDFTQLMDSTHSHVLFWLAFKACELKAQKTIMQEKKDSEMKRPWRPHGKSLGELSQITKKGFVAFKGRIK